MNHLEMKGAISAKWQKSANYQESNKAIRRVVALTLFTGFNYVDVAVRDLVMAISALSMARISKIVA